MTLFLEVAIPSCAIILSFSDRIIEYILPNGSLAKIADDVDDVLIHIDDQDDCHNA